MHNRCGVLTVYSYRGALPRRHSRYLNQIESRRGVITTRLQRTLAEKLDGAEAVDVVHSDAAIGFGAFVRHDGEAVRDVRRVVQRRPPHRFFRVFETGGRELPDIPG